VLTDLPFTFASLRQAYRDGTSPRDVIGEVYRRIAAVGDGGIFIDLLDEAEVREAASALDPADRERLPLWGIPFAIKDNIDAAGRPTTAACPAYSYDADEDAFAVAELRGAGALLVGKTNLDQFATGLVGIRSPYPPPLNAVDPEIVPGGSSSGTAVAVAHGLVAFSLGTDTAGSGRVPAALNNIVGLKPTCGALSASGVVPACRTLDTISIFALTVDDAYDAFRVAAAFDSADAYSQAVPAPPLTELPPAFRVGTPSAESREFFGDAAQAASFEVALGQIEDLGGEIVEIDFDPLYRVANLLYSGSWVAERYTVIEDLLKSDPDAIHPVTRAIISKAESFSAADAFRDGYRLADLKREVAPILSAVDMLCVPTIPTFYSVADLEADPVGPNTRLGTYTNFVNLLDLCGIAVPTSKRGDGRPGSVTLLAPAGADGRVAALAAALHGRAGVTLGATGWALPDPGSRPALALTDEIAIAVVGAHMSGLPLNDQLLDLGGRFLGTAHTAPEYRLHALADGIRPGLVRAEDGASIALEIWALPEAAFGAFMKGIAPPLGIGTIALEGGETVNGFLCEAHGLEGARDITDHGGWRAWLATKED